MGRSKEKTDNEYCIFV